MPSNEEKRPCFAYRANKFPREGWKAVAFKFVTRVGFKVSQCAALGSG